jgi:SGNH domain (fused to AT3 domains)
MYLGHEERLRQTLRELLSYTQDLVLMDQPPFASQMVVDTPSLKLEVGENLLKAMNGALRQGHPRFQVIESDSDRLKREEGSKLLARVAREFGPRIKIVATADLFQREASSVRVLDGNVPLYRDRSHLSDSGALVLTERLAGAMPVPHGLTLAQ